jgi:pimeloyl-ACP methyl ester carboxylesterase
MMSRATWRNALAIFSFVSIVAGCAAGPEENRRVIGEDLTIPGGDPGIQLYVRNKRPADLGAPAGERIVLFVHGATYPAHTAFDLPLGGMSWMDYMAARGYDVYSVDLRGYGRSTRPKEMDEAADKNSPLTTGDIAVRDIAATVDHILSRRGVKKINLVGWSWGTTLMATYTAANPDKVNRLVLYAPQWIRTTPSQVQAGPTLGAYRVVKKEDTLKRWLTGVPEAKKSTLIPAGWWQQWADATFATDPKGGGVTLRAPNGIIKDSRESWVAGKPYYDPAKIAVPVLITLGEWDNDTPPYMAQTLFPLLVNAPSKRLVMIGEATHTMLMERNRLRLFETVQAFLDERS